MNHLARRIVISAVVVGTALLLQGWVAFGQSDSGKDPLIGTWVMNINKSQFNPAVQMGRRTMVFTPMQNSEFHCVITTVETGGFVGDQTVQSQYTAGLDGKQYPTPDLAVATVSFKQIDKDTFERDGMRKGQEVETYKMKVSDGGKMLTVTVSGTNPGGMPYTSMQIYTKQDSTPKVAEARGQ